MIAINYGDYKFADFAQNVQNSTSTFMYGEEWLNQLLKISEGAINNNLSDKITFADDRLIEAAYKIMLLVDLKKVTLMEWAILKRYFDALYDGDKGTRDKIREYISAYIGSEFSDAEISKEISGSGILICFSGGTTIMCAAQKRYLILLRPLRPEIRTSLLSNSNRGSSLCKDRTERKLFRSYTPKSVGISSEIVASANTFLPPETVLIVLPFLNMIPWLIEAKFFNMFSVSLDSFINYSIIKIVFHVHLL